MCTVNNGDEKRYIRNISTCHDKLETTLTMYESYLSVWLGWKRSSATCGFVGSNHDYGSVQVWVLMIEIEAMDRVKAWMIQQRL